MAAVDDGRDRVRDYLGRQGERVVSLSHELLQPPTAGRMVVEYLATLQEDSPNKNKGDRRIENARPSAPGAQVSVGGCPRLAKKSVVAKFYLDERGPVAYEAMRSLHAGLEQDGPLAVPEPYFYDPRLRLLAQQRVPGRPCGPLLKHHSNTSVLKQLGIALACLHRQRGIRAEVKEMRHHVRDLIKPHPYALAEAYPEYRPLIEATLEILLRPAAEPFSYEASPIHRDFQLRQLFLTERQVWLVDWDTFALGDPAFDVAYFLIYLKTHFDVRRYEPFRDAFLAGYFRSPPPCVLERVGVYKAFNFLRRACRRFRIQDGSWQTELRRMMQLLESTIA